MRTEHGVLALALAGLAFATLNGDTTTPGGQAAGISLGLDVTTDGNTASALGTIDTYPRVKRRRFVRHRFVRHRRHRLPRVSAPFGLRWIVAHYDRSLSRPLRNSRGRGKRIS